MGTLYAFQLGPIPTDQGYGTIYVGFLDGQLIPAPQANNADDALATFRAQAPRGTVLECDPDFAAAGARHGFRGTPPGEMIVAVRAELAFVMAHPGLPPRASHELWPLMQGAAAFWKAKAWETLPADTPIEVVVTGAASATYEAAVMGEAGEEFGLALYTKPGSIAKVAAAVDAGRMGLVGKIDSISLTYDEGPRFAARAIEAFCGLARVPQAFGLRRGRPRPIEATEALVLASTLQAMSMMTGQPGEETTQGLTFGEVEIEVRVRVPTSLFAAEPSRPIRARRPR